MAQEKTLTPAGEAPVEPSEAPVTAEKPKEVETPIEPTKVNTEEYSDTEVIVSKAELEKLQEERTNYQKGMLSAKEALKETKQITEKKETDFLTKKDFYKSNEQAAIKAVCEDEKVEKNWDKIVTFYSSRRGMDTIADITADIQDAVYLWEKNNPSKEGEDKEAASNQAIETAKPAGGTTGKGKETKKSILLKPQQPVSEWYGKPDEDK